jgi:hypothetical protein
MINGNEIEIEIENVLVARPGPKSSQVIAMDITVHYYLRS